MNYYKDKNNKVYQFSDLEIKLPKVKEKIKSLTRMTETEVENFLNPSKTPKQTRQEKLNLLNNEWDNIKIAYDTANQICYQIKFGKEINDTLESNTLYNVEDLNNIIEVNENCHLYKVDRETINIFTSKITAKYEPLENENWYGSLGTYPLNMLEIGVVLEKANKIIQKLADEILGA